MDKHSAKKSGFASLFHYPVLVLFAAFFIGMFALDLASPDRVYSELENKKLEQRPTLTLSDLTGGQGISKLNTFVKKYEKYVKEQVVFRDMWIDLQSRSESLVFQKCENGGVLLGADHMMFARTYGLTAAERTALPKNIRAVAALAERWPGKVSVLIAPTAQTVYPEKLPMEAPVLDENGYLDDIGAQLSAAGATVVDVRSALERHKDEYIYYRTDHHWTTLGAYYAYEALCESLGLAPFDRASASAVEVTDFYGTNYSKARAWNTLPDTITYYALPNTLTQYTVRGATVFEPGETTGLYDLSAWETRDKYAAFLYGNNGLSRVEGSGTGRILVIKDSYANSFVPYLTTNYAVIDVVDLRNYNYGLDGLIDTNGYDDILVLYNFASFRGDGFLARAGVEG